MNRTTASHPRTLSCWAALLVTLPSIILHAQAEAPACYQGVFAANNLVDDWYKVTSFVNAAGKSPSIINVFQTWKTSGQMNPFSEIAVDMDRIRDNGAIPLVTWEPWTGGNSADTTFELQDIINGNYDSYIASWANAAKTWRTYGRPFFLRFMHEMNGDWYPWAYGVNTNTPDKYVKAFRRVHDIFRSNGVTNVTWVWCVNTAWVGSPALNQFYPGDQYVDWVGIDSYNLGNEVEQNHVWESFNARTWDTYQETTGTFQSPGIAYGKPVMIAETGCPADQPPDYKWKWFQDALGNKTTSLLGSVQTNFPRIKAWIYFNKDKNGRNNLIDSSPNSALYYKNGVGADYFDTNNYSSNTFAPISPLKPDKNSPDSMGPFVTIAEVTTSGTSDATTVPQSTSGVPIKVLTLDRSGIASVAVKVVRQSTGATIMSSTKTNPTTINSPNYDEYLFTWTVPSGINIKYDITATVTDNSGHTPARVTVAKVTVTSK